MANQIPEGYSDQSKKKIKETLDQVILSERIKKELQTLPKYQAYLAQFNPVSVENFINRYAFDKFMYLNYADTYQRQVENDLIGYRELAEERLWEIQQKKLFNLQCQWRAGQISLPEVDISYDFQKWQHNIRNCPFLEPITEEEIDLYIRFLRSNDSDDSEYRADWQEYEEITASHQNRDEDDSQSNIPAWYQFYDTYNNTASLMDLPDPRGEKEEFYLNLYFAKQKQNNADTEVMLPSDPQSMLPSIDCFDNKQIEDFVRICETRKELELYRNYSSFQDIDDDMEELEEALSILQEAHEVVAIETHHNWKEAVIKAARRYQNSQIALALPSVYEEYQFKHQANIGYDNDSEVDDSWMNNIKTQIIQGRLLNGESPDFNY